MDNKYLEKIASMYDFWNDLSGKEHKDLKARKAHLEKAIINKDTPASLGRKINTTGRRMFRARSQAIIGLASVGAAGAFGAKKYADQQNEIAKNNIQSMLGMDKKAAINPGKFWSTVKNTRQPFRAGGRAVFKTGNIVFKKGLKAVDKTVKKGVDVVNTAHGGKIDEFAVKKMGLDTKAYKKFKNATPTGQLRQAYRAGAKDMGAGASKSQRMAGGSRAIKDLTTLRKKQTAAKVGTYGTVAAGVTAHVKSDKKNQVSATNQYYY